MVVYSIFWHIFSWVQISQILIFLHLFLNWALAQRLWPPLKTYSLGPPLPHRSLLRAQQSLTSRLCLSQIITCDKQNDTVRLVNESGNPLGLSRSRLCFAESQNKTVLLCENNERRVVFEYTLFWNYSNSETFLNQNYILCSTILLN